MFVGWSHKLVRGSLDGNIRLWNESSGEILHVFSNSEIGDVYSVENYDGRYALSGSEDGIMRI